MSEEITNIFVDKLKIKLQCCGSPWIPRNKYNFVSDAKEILYYIAIAHYAKNKMFMQNGIKRYNIDIKNMKPNISKDLDRLLAIDDKFDREDKAVYLKKIITKLES